MHAKNIAEIAASRWFIVAGAYPQNPENVPRNISIMRILKIPPKNTHAAWPNMLGVRSDGEVARARHRTTASMQAQVES
jgi:hypothetical protein